MKICLFKGKGEEGHVINSQRTASSSLIRVSARNQFKCKGRDMKCFVCVCVLHLLPCIWVSMFVPLNCFLSIPSIQRGGHLCTYPIMKLLMGGNGIHNIVCLCACVTTCVFAGVRQGTNVPVYTAEIKFINTQREREMRHFFCQNFMQTWVIYL